MKVQGREIIGFRVALAALAALSLGAIGQPGLVLGNSSEGSAAKFCASTLRDNYEPKVRIGLSWRSVYPGGVIKSRIENGGARDLGYGREQVLQKFKSGHWVNLPQKPVLQSQFVVSAGMAGRCRSIHIPASAQPGLYRVRQMVAPIASNSPKRFPLFAYFRVV